MPLEHAQAGEPLDVPRPHRPVVGAAEETALGHDKRAHRAGVPGERAERGEGLRVPDADGAVVGAGEEARAGHRESPHGVHVPWSRFIGGFSEKVSTVMKRYFFSEKRFRG